MIFIIFIPTMNISKCTDVYIIISRYKRSAGMDKQGSYIVLYIYIRT